MYPLVDLVFVIKRNWELWAPGSCYPSWISWTCNQHISITVLETTDLVHADLILFTSLLTCVAGATLTPS